MDRNNTFIPYNAKLSNEEVKALFSSNDSKPFNVISINDYNNILKSFTEKDEKEKDFKRRAQEREKIRLKGLKLAERIKNKSNGHTSVYERIKEKELMKERERQRINEEWKKIMDREKEDNMKKMKEKIFNSKSDVVKFNKKIQESNMLYERQLQVEFKRKRQELRDRLDKEFEKKQVQKLNNNIYVQKMEDNRKKLKEIDDGKLLREQMIKNKELKIKLKKEEDEEILKSEGLIFDPEKTEEEKRESLRKLYEDIDKQIQQKQKLKQQQLEKEEQFNREILEYNNNKSNIQEKIKNVKINEINNRIKGSELVGKQLKSERKEQIDKLFEINSNKEYIFSDEPNKKVQNQFMKHFLENTEYQFKQAEEARKHREKEKEENRQFYYEKGVRAYNELKEEEIKCAEKEKLKNLELQRINKQLMEEKKKRDLEAKDDKVKKRLDEEKRKEDKEFNDYVLECINDLEMRGRDTRNLYSSLIIEKSKVTKQDIDSMPDTFRRLGINGIHNGDDDIVSYLQSTKNS